LRMHLVETSPRLRAAQAAALPEGVAWHDGLASVPAGPMLLLANEFLDALPIRQFVRRESQWMERFVEDGSFVESPVEDDTFLLPLPPGEGWGEGGLAAERRATSAPSAPSLVIHACTDPPPHPDPLPEGEGAVIELCEPARAVAVEVAARVARDGGAALFLDYGPEHSAAGDSLQALQNGKPADPLAAPGEADLTAHVDFAALARAASGARVHGPAPQGLFLARLGLFQRSGRLARTQPPAKAASLMQAAQRLAEPDRMGRLFKALCIANPDLPTPAGFEP
ncbi:MAG TPA: SAM-dependent methyltransferase, partial [Acetobacteraceae bacterium]